MRTTLLCYFKDITVRTAVTSGARKGKGLGKFTKRALQCLLPLKHLFFKAQVRKKYSKMLTSSKCAQ